MTRGQSRNKGKDKRNLSQTPDVEILEEGIDVEYETEFADDADLKAQERAKAADERAHRK
ncbi:hypothetical protein N781_02905 [Pontibacillus halophilus JSM 076056 = DSM 19796]|uniref:YfhD family protein n=1 Tax=Pontibacillus halophilus JSM 076056 = DSM 19796 TaxID=1385510 RepID=A0A0A5GLC7_9BACI|nr:YfhD family protein [Pontibacillus halophilus]KGX91993.1 hypothetical protein N781_02905 [Pontibacillus halophilus JSM 076056 = DSM 19796]